MLKAEYLRFMLAALPELLLPEMKKKKKKRTDLNIIKQTSMCIFSKLYYLKSLRIFKIRKIAPRKRWLKNS